mgnify:CR=1 FL=1
MLFMAAKIHKEDRQIASYRTHQEIHGKAIAMSNHTIPPGDELDRVFHIKVISVGSLFAVGISDDTFPGTYNNHNHHTLHATTRYTQPQLLTLYTLH